jgi:hypothetical protein
MAGAVQHGASTLPAEAFSEFPRHEAAEVHLATEFQNMTLDHPDFPKELRAEMLAWCDKNCADERKPDMTAEQFHYKTRKKTWGPFKAQTWGLPEATRASLRDTLQSKFEFLYQKLNVAGRMATVRKIVKPADVRVPPPPSLGA